MKKIIIELKEDFKISDIIEYDQIEIVCDNYEILWKPLLDIRDAMPNSKIYLTKRGLGNIITAVLVLEKLDGMNLIMDDISEINKLRELDNFLTLYEPDRWELILKPENIKLTNYKFKRWELPVV